MTALESRPPRLLLSYHTDPALIPPPVFPTEQVTCGPAVEHRMVAGRVISLRTPSGEYDIRSVVAQLPRDQRPDLLVVSADATNGNLPHGIDGLGIPSILVLGDTHHLDLPIRRMIAYARSEAYTAHVVAYNRQHLHWFTEAGCARVAWLPAALRRDYPVPLQQRRKGHASFVTRRGQLHVVRNRLIQALETSGRPVVIGRASAEQASLYHATSLISLNHSLNGDLNLRVFEAMAAGGCLLTDRLPRQSGLETLFRDGTHLVLFEGIDDLLARMDHLLADPAAAMAIATAGHAAIGRDHTPARRLTQLATLARTGGLPAPYRAADEPRVLLAGSRDRTAFMRRIAQYEYVQEWHRTVPALSAIALPGADPLALCDLADLARLRLWRTSHDWDPMLASAGVLDQIAVAHPAELRHRGWDLAIAAAADLDDPAVITAYRPEAILVTGSLTAAADRTLVGYRPAGPHDLGVYRRSGVPARVVSPG